jgi:hypothetical protein
VRETKSSNMVWNSEYPCSKTVIYQFPTRTTYVCSYKEEYKILDESKTQMQATATQNDINLLLILKIGTRCGRVVSVTPWPCFIPGERTPGTHCTGGWVGLTASLDTEVRGKISCLCQRSNLDRPVVQPIARHYPD